MNERARTLLRRGDALFDKGGRLHARLPVDEARLQGLLASALPADDLPAASGSLSVGGSSTAPRITLHVMPVTAYPLGYDLWRVAAIALLIETGPRSQIDSDLVATVLGLTPAEGRVAALLAGGHTVRNIAFMSGTRESSVRSHMKRIYGKRGISRQADLVRQVLSIAEPPEPSDMMPALTPSGLAAVRLPVIWRPSSPLGEQAFETLQTFQAFVDLLQVFQFLAYVLQSTGKVPVSLFALPLHLSDIASYITRLLVMTG